MTEAELREVNRVPPGMLVKAGSTLLVPRHPNRRDEVTAPVADHATHDQGRDGPTLRRSTVKARQGDSVASIATRYRVSAARVADWNQVSAGEKFRSGQSVVLYLPPKPSAKTKSAKQPAAAQSSGASRRVAATAR
jgi:membrane-bound lytic murein transglycosylase D